MMHPPPPAPLFRRRVPSCPFRWRCRAAPQRVQASTAQTGANEPGSWRWWKLWAKQL